MIRASQVERWERNCRSESADVSFIEQCKRNLRRLFFTGEHWRYQMCILKIEMAKANINIASEIETKEEMNG